MKPIKEHAVSLCDLMLGQVDQVGGGKPLDGLAYDDGEFILCPSMDVGSVEASVGPLKWCTEVELAMHMSFGHGTDELFICIGKDFLGRRLVNLAPVVGAPEDNDEIPAEVSLPGIVKEARSQGPEAGPAYPAA